MAVVKEAISLSIVYSYAYYSKFMSLVALLCIFFQEYLQCMSFLRYERHACIQYYK